VHDRKLVPIYRPVSPDAGSVIRESKVYLKSGIPPEIDENNVIARRKIQTSASSLEGDENDPCRLARPDILQRRFSVFRMHGPIIWKALSVMGNWKRKKEIETDI